HFPPGMFSTLYELPLNAAAHVSSRLAPGRYALTYFEHLGPGGSSTRLEPIDVVGGGTFERDIETALVQIELRDGGEPLPPLAGNRGVVRVGNVERQVPTSGRSVVSLRLL